MTIMLIGGSGLLGGAIAKQLRGRDEPLRAFVRTGKRATLLREHGFRLEIGDLRDPRALRRTFAGVRAIITTAQGDPFDRRKSVTSVDGTGNQTLIQIATEAGIEHIVFISVLKADTGADSAPHFLYKYTAELALKASGMRYTIIRPSSFQELFGDGFAPFKRIIERSGIGLTLGPGAGKHSFVAINDVARAAVIALDHPQAQNATIPIGGPDDLDFHQAYARIAQVAGRPIQVISMPYPLLQLGGLLASPVLPELSDFFAMFDFFDRAGYTCQTPEWLVAALGHRRSFDQAICEMYGLAADGSA